MRIMDKKEQQLFSVLIQAANGDLRLVEEALKANATQGKVKLDAAIQYLKQKRTHD